MTCNRNECKGETDTANTIMARDYKGIGNQDMTAVAIKVKEATKQGYANALVGGGQTASICPCQRARPEGGEWVAIWQTH